QVTYLARQPYTKEFTTQYTGEAHSQEGEGLGCMFQLDAQEKTYKPLKISSIILGAGGLGAFFDNFGFTRRGFALEEDIPYTDVNGEENFEADAD
ncbi:MAG: hypothetical protein K6G62_03525, partial [Eubacterium sp.]|nr:hypothetical protein [Eubacterium sp.]